MIALSAETAIYTTDQNENIYLTGYSDLKALSVFVFDKNMTLKQEYNKRKGMELTCGQPCVVSDNSKLFALNVASDIQVFDFKKHFVKRLGAEMLNNAKDITYVNTGKIMVLSCDIGCGYLVHLFSEDGECLSQFKLAKEQFIPPFIKFHHPSEKVLVVSESKDTLCKEFLVSLYSIDGVFIRDIRIRIPARFSLFEGVKRIAVTKEGRVAISDTKRVLLV